MMSPACVLLYRGEPDGDDGPLGARRFVHRQLGTHAPLALCPSQTAKHFLQGDVLEAASAPISSRTLSIPE